MLCNKTLSSVLKTHPKIHKTHFHKTQAGFKDKTRPGQNPGFITHGFYANPDCYYFFEIYFFYFLLDDHFRGMTIQVIRCWVFWFLWLWCL